MKLYITVLIAAAVLLTMLDIGESGYGYHGYGYGGYRNRYRYRYGYGKRGMKKIASRQRINDVHAELNDDAKVEHLKENLAEVKRNP